MEGTGDPAAVSNIYGKAPFRDALEQQTAQMLNAGMAYQGGLGTAAATVEKIENGFLVKSMGLPWRPGVVFYAATLLEVAERLKVIFQVEG